MLGFLTLDWAGAERRMDKHDGVFMFSPHEYVKWAIWW